MLFVGTAVYRKQLLFLCLLSCMAIFAAKAVKVPADGMLSDLHGSAEYRAALVSVMASRAVT